MKRRSLKAFLMVLPLLVVLGSAPRAEAKLFEVWGSALAGYGVGNGTSDQDFYRWVSGGAIGAEVGVKVLFIGAFVDYLHWFGRSSGAELITFNLGGDWNIDLTDRLSLVIRVAGGYYHGILPEGATSKDDIGIVSSMVNTRGVGARAGLGLRFSFAKVLSLGVTPELGYHYFFGGSDQSVTDNNSSGWDLNILAYFRVGFGF